MYHFTPPIETGIALPHNTWGIFRLLPR